MKKQYWIVIALGAAALVGGWQWNRLQDAEGKKRDLVSRKKGLEERSEEVSRERRVQADRREGLIPRVAGVSEKEVSGFHEDLIGMFLASLEGEKGDRDQVASLIAKTKDFSTENIAQLADLIRADDRIPESNEKFGDLRGEIFDEVIGEFTAQTTPFQTLLYLQEHPLTGGHEFSLAGVFSLCFQHDSELAMSLYEKEVAAGNSDFEDSRIRFLVLKNLSKQDPDKMFKMAFSPEFGDDPIIFRGLGRRVASEMENSKEALTFFAALDRVKQTEENSEALQKIRTDLVKELIDEFYNWPFEQTKEVVSLKFTESEKNELSYWMADRGGLDEVEKWADWFSNIKAEDWSQWAGERPNYQKHPLVELLTKAGRSNPEFGEQHLEKMPEGTLRDDAMLAFAYELASSQPERARPYLDQLPKSQGKNRLAKKLRQR